MIFYANEWRLYLLILSWGVSFNFKLKMDSIFDFDAPQFLDLRENDNLDDYFSEYLPYLLCLVPTYPVAVAFANELAYFGRLGNVQALNNSLAYLILYFFRRQKNRR